MFGEGSAAGRVDLDIPGGTLMAITEKSKVAMTTVAAIRERPSRMTSLRSDRGGFIIRVASIIASLSVCGGTWHAPTLEKLPGATLKSPREDRASPVPTPQISLGAPGSISGARTEIQAAVPRPPPQTETADAARQIESKATVRKGRASLFSFKFRESENEISTMKNSSDWRRGLP